MNDEEERESLEKGLEKIEAMQLNELQNEEDALKTFEQDKIEEPKPKKHKWLGNILLIAVIAVGVFLMFKITSEFSGEANKSFGEAMASVDTLYLFITLAVLLAVIVLDSMKYSVVMSAVSGKYHPLIGAQTSFLGKYYDNITPFSTGGQPMQIYNLYKKGFPGGSSGAIVMIKYFANTFIWLLISGLLMALNASAFSLVEKTTRATIKAFAWVSWGINMLVPLFIVTFLLLPKLSYKMTSGIISLGAKIRIVKDKDKTLQKAIKVVEDFRASFSIMVKHPFKFIWLLGCCALEICLTFAFPYFVAKMFGELKMVDTGLQAILNIMTVNAFTSFAVSLIPTPGNSGFWEGASSMAFKSIATSAWVLFTWRFLVYYIYIVIGIVIYAARLIINLAAGHKRRA